MNYLWIDVETTGLNEKKNDIIQLACIPIINNIPQKPFNEFCQPLNWETVEQEALDIHGITLEALKTFQSSQEMFSKFIDYISSFDVKFTIAGFNVAFDKRFLSASFSKLSKNQDFSKLFTIDLHARTLDPEISMKLKLLINNVLEEVNNQEVSHELEN